MNRIAMLSIALLTALTAGAGPLSIKVQVDPAMALPGIPVHLVLAVENTSGVGQKLPELFTLEATPESGQAFLPNALPEFPVQTFPKEYHDALTIGPGQTRVYDLPLASELTARVVGDPRLWEPGSYGLRVYFHDELRNEDIARFGLHGLLGAGRISTPLLASAGATLRIERPSGIDAEIWNAIVKKTVGRGLAISTEEDSDAVARELWARSQESAYGPYLVYYIRKVTAEKRKEIWAKVIERDPSHPIAQTIRIASARRMALEAKWSIEKGADLAPLLARTEQARRALKTLASEVTSDLLRIAVQSALTEIKSREELIEIHHEIAPKR
jgi:hypothetical protein